MLLSIYTKNSNNNNKTKKTYKTIVRTGSNIKAKECVKERIKMVR